MKGFKSIFVSSKHKINCFLIQEKYFQTANAVDTLFKTSNIIFLSLLNIKDNRSLILHHQLFLKSSTRNHLYSLNVGYKRYFNTSSYLFPSLLLAEICCTLVKKRSPHLRDCIHPQLKTVCCITFRLQQSFVQTFMIQLPLAFPRPKHFAQSVVPLVCTYGSASTP